MRVKSAQSLAAAVCFTLCLAGGAAAETGELAKPVNLWPLLYHEREGERSEWEALFSLYRYERERARLSLALYPFYARQSDPERREWRWHVFWQFARYERMDSRRRLHVLPLFWRQWDAERSRSVLFPLYSYDRNPDRRRLGLIGYSPFSLFDFERDFRSGESRNRLLLFSQRSGPGRSSATFLPLFHHARDDARGLRHLSLLGLPRTLNLFEHRAEGDARQWHALTLYRGSEAGESATVLAPLYWHFDGKGGETRHFWPLYGYRREGSALERSTLWPLFRCRADPQARTSDLNLLWPLYRRLREPGRRHDRFFPLYSRTEDPKGEPEWHAPGMLSPLPLLYRRSGKDFSHDRLFWLAWRSREPGRRRTVALTYYDFADDSAASRRRGVFPLWHRSSRGDGSLDLAPLWLAYKRPDLELRALFPVYWRYRADATRLDAALPIYLRYAGPRHDWTSFFPLYYRNRDSSRDSEWTYYFPLYGTQRIGRHRRRRLLLFPLWSRLSDAEAGLSSIDALWPLFHYERSADGSATRILPLFWRTRSPESGFSVAFPVYWHFWDGKTRHRHWPPLYGEYRRDDFSLRYFLGPLVIQRRDRDYARTDVLGSLYSRTRYGDETSSHLFPLYWSKSRAGVRRRLVLPLFGYEAADSGRSLFALGLRERLSLFAWERDTDAGERRWRALNLYARTGRDSSLATFFPLYWHWTRDAAKGTALFPVFASKRDSRAGSYDHSFLGFTDGFGLIEFAEDPGADRRMRRVLLYHQQRDGQDRLWTLFPLYWRWEKPDSSGSLAPLLYAHRRDADGFHLGLLGFGPRYSLFSYRRADEESSHRLFPLYQRRRAKDGGTLALLGVQGFSIFEAERGPDFARHRFLPFYGYRRHGRPGREGYSEEASVLWPLFRSRRTKDASDMRLLFRVARFHREPERSALELNPFFYRIRRGKNSYWAILGGLVGLETRSDGSKKLRLFWLGG